jgi:hypothetical protein
MLFNEMVMKLCEIRQVLCHRIMYIKEVDIAVHVYCIQ